MVEMGMIQPCTACNGKGRLEFTVSEMTFICKECQGTGNISESNDHLTDSLIVMRAQPLHVGHIRLIDEAIKNSRNVVIVLGSIQEHGTSRNPFTYSERKKMIKRYITSNFIDSVWDHVFVMGLKDIFSLRWPYYVMEEISNKFPDLEIKTVFGGSEYDCNWFKDIGLEQKICNRTDQGYDFLSASMIREMLEYGDERWQKYVPSCYRDIVIKKYGRNG